MLFSIKAVVARALRKTNARGWMLAAMVAAAAAILPPVQSFADKGVDFLRPLDPLLEAGAQGDPTFEARFVSLLSDGKQGDAERLLSAELAQYPEATRLVELVAAKKEKEAHDFKMRHFVKIHSAQRALFLSAVCDRSRFEKERAFATLNTVWMLDHRTRAAKCAYQVLWMDSEELYQSPKKEVDRAFSELQQLADANPDDLMIRWMLAVQCRNWGRNEEGVKVYQQILAKWQPGPVLVHQTYANLLDNLHRYDEALVERRLAVSMSPAYWTYDGLGNTLHGLSRFQEACDAHAIATAMNPRRSSNWSNWAKSLNGLGKYDEAIEKSQRALKIDPRNWRAYWIWGTALAELGKPEEALKKCQAATAIYNKSPLLNDFVADLEKQLKQ
ncbi:MAG TPA: tetratricopeptide repeat protein [Pirellulales bacterium]|jgi:tetratricopeptide (TPR) repeat protein